MRLLSALVVGRTSPNIVRRGIVRRAAEILFGCAATDKRATHSHDVDPQHYGAG